LDVKLPVNFWRDVLGYGKTDADMIYQDYVVTENVICMSPYAWPERIPSDKFPPNGIDDDGDGFTDEGPDDPAGSSETNTTNGIDDDGDGCVDDSSTSATPDGRQANPFNGFTPFFNYSVYGYAASGAASLSGSPWWNDNRSTNWKDPRLPAVVTANFWLMFSSPYPGAPDFQRLFSLDVNLPTGYARVPEL